MSRYPNAILEVLGTTVSFRISQGKVKQVPSAGETEGLALAEALERTIESRKRLVILEAMGLKPEDRLRARVLLDALKEAVESTAGEKPICMPPSSASGLVSCSFEAYYEDFGEFKRRLVASIERSVYTRLDNLTVTERMIASTKLKLLILAAVAIVVAALLLVSL